MAGMEGLGRLFNVVPAAIGLYINATYCSAVTFICTGGSGNSVFTFHEATDSGGDGAQVVGSIIDHYYTTNDTDGSLAWAKVTQSAADTTGTINNGYVAAVCIEGSKLDAGFSFVAVTATNSGTAIAILHDLTVQRKPANLALPGE